MNKTQLRLLLGRMPSDARNIRVDGGFTRQRGSFEYVSFDTKTITTKFWELAKQPVFIEAGWFRMIHRSAK